MELSVHSCLCAVCTLCEWCYVKGTHSNSTRHPTHGCLPLHSCCVAKRVKLGICVQSIGAYLHWCNEPNLCRVLYLPVQVPSVASCRWLSSKQSPPAQHYARQPVDCIWLATEARTTSEFVVGGRDNDQAASLRCAKLCVLQRFVETQQAGVAETQHNSRLSFGHCTCGEGNSIAVWHVWPCRNACL